jgi:hypothetical protein
MSGIEKPKKLSRLAAIGALASASIITSCHIENYGAITKATSSSELTSAADASKVADRIMPNVLSVPDYPTIPQSVIDAVMQDVVSVNMCTGSIVRDEDGSALGVQTAKHCIRYPATPAVNPLDIINTIYLNSLGFKTGPSINVSYPDIYRDPARDIAYLPLNGHTALQARQQVIDNLNAVNINSFPLGLDMFMTGFPRHNNYQRHTIELKYGGISNWGSSQRRINAFGNWVTGSSCSMGSSGAGLYAIPPGEWPILLGTLSDHAEFFPVITMPYSASYGEEIKDYVEVLLDVNLDAEFMCVFSTPADI